MKVYINSSESISPQNTFDVDSFLETSIPLETEYFTCLKPEYKDYINPKLMRRMSNVIRMGVANATVCLQKAEVADPDAIVIGTGLGCLADTVKFLAQLDENNETMLNPTAFIQSTHNTVSGQIALLLSCKSHNLTFSQGSLSFETALTDSFMLLKDNDAQNVLVGGLDEIVPESFAALQQTTCCTATADGTAVVQGEGSSFFVLSNVKSDKNIAELKAVSIKHNLSLNESIIQSLKEFLASNDMTLDQIDVFVSGRTNNAKSSEKCAYIAQHLPQSIVVEYKHLIGEYDTASAFGLWLGTRIVSKKKIPAICGASPQQNGMKNVLIYNTTKGIYHSFMLLSEC